MHNNDILDAPKQEKMRQGRPKRRLAVIAAVALAAMASVVGLMPASPASAVTVSNHANVIMGDWGGFGHSQWRELTRSTTSFSAPSSQRINATLCQEWTNQPGDAPSADFWAMLAAYGSNMNYNYAFIVDVTTGPDRYFACNNKTYH